MVVIKCKEGYAKGYVAGCRTCVTYTKDIQKARVFMDEAAAKRSVFKGKIIPVRIEVVA